MVLLFYILFSLMMFTALCISLILMISVYTYKRKDQLPVVYIYLMIACSIGCCFVEFQSDIIPYFMKRKAYMWMYSNLGESFTLFDTFVYIYPMFLTVLMVSERIYCILYPFGKAFTNKKLWCYCFLIAIVLLSILLIPFFGGCADNYSFYDFDYTSECEPDNHIVTYIIDNYSRLFPVLCLFLNIGIILYLSKRRKKMENPAMKKLRTRQSHDRTLLIQSIAATIFLLIYEIMDTLTDFFSDYFDALPTFTQRVIYYLQAGIVAYTGFFIYFVCTSSTRQIVIEQVARLFGRKRMQQGRTGLSIRDVSTF
ncbi:G_PROTEIN_RECEP_F1_2 domain-containing protein [Caenorhabditis elegans]|uniref:G_PROTEIN_RECEP_F1_2 domain-containing protein n=1 Tax=Caenorhabditis elegans TaxID=6239 RepID=Q58AA1_CAEEL|nr:G_PROTEIN_RECEP_F1_2 domain-containing protein [Caenorhabditis elegans]CAI70405.1 G_PROTEIN_RECEP_F1_2 domain-containing protein [Caenorhabditis elegans]|eukprot:NP_001021369.1 Serpentine Receptor, class XA [Caenorhabditis elegans]